MGAATFTIEQPQVRAVSNSSVRHSAFKVLLTALPMVAVPSSAYFVQIFSKPAEVSYPSIKISKESFLENLAESLGAAFEVKSALLNRLDHLKTTLKPNWNGEDDLPIEQASYLNTKAAIEETPARLLKHWDLFPDPNGTLLLSPKDESVAGISIGNSEFSYAAYVSDDKQFSGKEPFSIEAFSDALKQIHRLLGYA